jgi:hypothetical protein
MIKDKAMIRMILGKVELNTLDKKTRGLTLSQVERNYLYRSIKPKLIAASILAQQNLLKKINRRRQDPSIIEYNLSRYG